MRPSDIEAEIGDDSKEVGAEGAEILFALSVSSYIPFIVVQASRLFNAEQVVVSTTASQTSPADIKVVQDEIDEVKKQIKDLEKKIDGLDAEIMDAKRRGDRDEVVALRAEKQQLMAKELQLRAEKQQLSGQIK